MPQVHFAPAVVSEHISWFINFRTLLWTYCPKTYSDYSAAKPMISLLLNLSVGSLLLYWLTLKPHQSWQIQSLKAVLSGGEQQDFSSS